MRRLLIILILLMLPVSGWGANRYVNGTGGEWVGTYASYGIGADSGTGTDPSSPWATLGYAYANLTGGDSVYVAGGAAGHTYSEDFSMGTSGHGASWYADGDVTWYDGTGQYVRYDSHTWNDFIFAYASGNAFRNNNTTLTFNGCTITMTGTASWAASSGDNSWATQVYIFNDCTFNCGSTAAAVLSLSTDNATYTIDGCTVEMNTGSRIFIGTDDAGGARTHSVTLKNSTVNINADRPSAKIYAIVTIQCDASGTHVLSLTDNNFVVDDGVEGLYSTDGYGNWMVEISGTAGGGDSITATMTGNTFDFSARRTTSGSDYGIKGILIRNAAISPSILNNAFYFYLDSDQAIFIDTAAGAVSVGMNTVRGPAYYSNTPSGCHAMTVRDCANAIIYRNLIIGTAYAIVLKGTSAGITTLSSGGIYFNVAVDCTGAVIHPRGISGVPVCNNTIINSNTRGVTTSQGIYYASDGEANATNGTVRNNIIATFDSNSYLAIDVDANNDTGFTSDYNVIYQANTGSKIAEVGATEYANWAAWQGAGYDAHGINADPKLIGTSNFHLQATSPCINAGTSPFSDGDGDQYDYAGNLVWRDSDDKAVGAWSDGVEIGAYGWFGGVLLQ